VLPPTREEYGPCVGRRPPGPQADLVNRHTFVGRRAQGSAGLVARDTRAASSSAVAWQDG
jgi:hypothetical protein